MKVLVIGQGGREHVLAWKLSQSKQVTNVFCAPGNAGTSREAKTQNVDISSDDLTRLTRFAVEEEIDLAVVGPEAPLVAGLVDSLQAENIVAFGPTANAAALEGSKVFAKTLMRTANVPTADYRVFHESAEALSYLDELGGRCVVKADGLAAGKGAIVCANRDEARDAVKRLMVDREFGDAGVPIVIEECLEGQEVSVLALVDGRTIAVLDSSQDHKRAYDDDRGPNTGGMGAYSPTPLIDRETVDQIISKVLLPTVMQMQEQGRLFRGVLYAGLMLTKDGPKVLEFNVRFGDPEAQPVLMRLRTDLADVLLATATGKLSTCPALDWDPRPAVCVVMAAEGYPGPYDKGRPIRGLDDAETSADVKVFHAGTAQHGDDIVTNGGRVLGVTALGETLDQAKFAAYQAVKPIRWDGAWCRKDISDKARGH